MANRRLSDAQIEAMIEGEPVEGAPAQLSELVASLRARADAAPRVPVSGALHEFIVEGAATTAAEPATGGGLAVAAGPIRRVAKAASVLGVVPAYLLVGATIAAAAVGGAHVIGVVDVPLLPDRGRSVVEPPPTDPEAPVSEQPVVAPSTTAPATTAPATTAPPTTAHGPTDADTSASTPTRPRPTGPVAVPENPGMIDPGSVWPMLPTPAPLDGDPGCELGQDAATDQSRHAPDPVPTPPDPHGDPCDPAVTSPAPPATPTPTPATPAPTTPTAPTPTTPAPTTSAPATPPAPATTPAATPTTSTPRSGEQGSEHGDGDPSPDTAPPESGAGEAEESPTPAEAPSENLGPSRTPEGG